MKRLQCTKCHQVYWTELDQAYADRIGKDEWIRNLCPKCGSEWAIVEPKKKPLTDQAMPPRMKRLALSQSRTRVKRERPAQKKEEARFTPNRIRTLRKKLGISQKGLASLLSVSTNSVAFWESGKFQPKKDKLQKLGDLEKKGKEEVRKLLGEKRPPAKQEKKPLQRQEKKNGRTSTVR